MEVQENKLITFVKGISGTGKSSRVLQLLNFYTEILDYNVEEIKHYNEKKEKECHVGLLVKEANVLFIGKLYERDDVVRFQGHDSVTGSFNGSEDFSNFLKQKSKKYKIIVEGSGTTLSFRFRPKYLFDDGLKKMFFQYYNYDRSEKGKEDYKNRILIRTGKVIEKDSMWNKGESFKKEYEKTLLELEKVNGDIEAYHFYDDHTPPIYDFGEKFLVINNEEETTIQYFIDYCNVVQYEKLNIYKNDK